MVEAIGLGTVVLAIADASELQPLCEALYLRWHVFISLKVFCKRQFPQKSVNSYFIITDIKNKLTDLWGN